jgi:hypothetical protein
MEVVILHYQDIEQGVGEPQRKSRRIEEEKSFLSFTEF